MNDLITVSELPIQLALEYGKLTLHPNISEHEANRIEEIMALACDDPLLDFWLSEIDHCIGHRLGLLDGENLEIIRNQEALLREYLETLIQTCEIENGKIPDNFLETVPNTGSKFPEADEYIVPTEINSPLTNLPSRSDLFSSSSTSKEVQHELQAGRC